MTYFNTPEVSHERKTESDSPFADALPLHPRRGICLRRTIFAIWIQRLALPPKRQLCRNHLSEKDASCAYRGSHAETYCVVRANRDVHAETYCDARANRDVHAETDYNARANRYAYAGTYCDARAHRDVHAETDPDARANGSSSLYRRRLYYGFHNGARGKCISFAQSGPGRKRPFRA